MWKTIKRYETINLGESEVIKSKRNGDRNRTRTWKICHQKNLPMQPGDVQKTNADIQNPKNLINYSKTKYQNGIKIFVEWF